MMVLVYFLIIISFLAPSIDIFKNPFTFQKYFFVDSAWVWVVSLTALTVLRFWTKYELSNKLKSGNKYLLFPILIIISVGLTVWDYFTEANFIYSNFFVNYQRIFLMALGSGYIAILFSEIKYLRTNHKKIIFD
ncbi:MAG: hypothetical protein WBO70_06000 [Erysipelotrichaceae bacterium]